MKCTFWGTLVAHDAGVREEGRGGGGGSSVGAGAARCIGEACPRTDVRRQLLHVSEQLACVAGPPLTPARAAQRWRKRFIWGLGHPQGLSRRWVADDSHDDFKPQYKPDAGPAREAIEKYIKVSF